MGATEACPRGLTHRTNPVVSSTALTAVILSLVAAACALPGVFLLLRRMSLVSDAVGHVLLFGIVLTYFVVRDVDSPWLFAGAAAAGLASVALVELLQKTRLVKEDAAIGLVFPALFAGGVLLASVYLRNTHLDADAVLLGHPDLATGDERQIGGVFVPAAGLRLAGVLALNLALLLLFFKELKLTTFDPALAAALGFRPGRVHYGLMAVVSVTAVAAFDAVGPVLVVGFFVVPAAAAYLLTDRLGVLLVVAGVIGVGAAWAGTYLAAVVDANTAGAVAAVLGAMFAAVFVFAPGRGLVAQAARRWRQRRDFFETMLTVHLLHHEGTATEADESAAAGLHTHFHWTPRDTAAVVRRAVRHGLVERAGEGLKLTATGRERARDVGPASGRPA
ncbi:Manganese transport system membrane protein MntB [Urbifossiella limnaea]|uniref:Manganese transport system membrane protein MntB n=1 Tax=Urbifossiella limnaea TaxID=2528023 RepID=A0A517XTM8_9BACT|nr:Manganese transport system membrane protein MntB [Urbifossiella limnaea]